MVKWIDLYLYNLDNQLGFLPYTYNLENRSESKFFHHVRFGSGCGF